jgi:hypothetical protein
MDMGVGSPTMTHAGGAVLIGGSGGGVLSRLWSIPSLCLRDYCPCLLLLFLFHYFFFFLFFSFLGVVVVFGFRVMRRR